MTDRHVANYETQLNCLPVFTTTRIVPNNLRASLQVGYATSAATEPDEAAREELLSALAAEEDEDKDAT
jgi:hypothetical protein